MEQVKRKNGLMGVLIVIIVLLLCVVGYLLFGNKMMNNKAADTTTTTTTSEITTTTIPTTTTIKNDESEDIVVLEEPTRLLSDSELKTDFSNLTKRSNGIELKFDCKFFDNSACYVSYVIIDNIIKIESDLYTCGTLNKIIRTDKYYLIENGTGCGVDKMSFTIYNLSGKELFNENNGTIYKNKAYVDGTNYYFNTYKVVDEESNINKLYYKYIDLSKEKISEIEVKSENVTDMPGEVT